jgi:hypothetical protein
MLSPSNKVSPRRPVCMVPIVLGVVLGRREYYDVVSVVPGIACSVVPVVLGSACLVPVLGEVPDVLGVGPSFRVLVVPVVSLLSWVESRHPRPCILMKREDDKLEGVRERIEEGVCTVLTSMQGYEFKVY